MACGIPCVATDVGDCREILSGLAPVVAPGDVSAIAVAILAAIEERLHGPFCCGQLGIERRIHAAPEIGQHGRSEILRAGHGRNRRDHFGQLPVGGDRHRRLGAFGNPGKRAQRGHVAHPEFPPVGQHRRQRRPDLVGTEDQQAVPGAPRKRLLKPRAARGLQRGCLRRLSQDQESMRRENGREHHHDGCVLNDLTDTSVPGPKHLIPTCCIKGRSI